MKQVEWIYLAIGISGLAALGAEVVWTRLLSLLLGGTFTHSRSFLRSFFAASGWAAARAHLLLAELSHPVMALAVCQSSADPVDRLDGITHWHIRFPTGPWIRGSR